MTKIAFVRRSFLLTALTGGLLSVGPVWAQRSLSVPGRERWLRIVGLQGRVDFIPWQGTRRQAQVGDRLDQVGDRIITAPDSSARLELDQATGFVSVAESSHLQVQTLSVTRGGGRITEIFVHYGQARLRIRPLTNPATRIEIHTPAGVSGVRGTDFGVAVQLDGRTGVATLEGAVAASAQGEQVMISANQQSTILPGEPPTPPEPLRDDPTLNVEVLRELPGQQDSEGRPLVQVAGYTDRVNLMEVNEEQRELDRFGRYNITVPIDAARRIRATITTPLGTVQQYELVVPSL